MTIDGANDFDQTIATEYRFLVSIPAAIAPPAEPNLSQESDLFAPSGAAEASPLLPESGS